MPVSKARTIVPAIRSCVTAAWWASTSIAHTRAQNEEREDQKGEQKKIRSPPLHEVYDFLLIYSLIFLFSD